MIDIVQWRSSIAGFNAYRGPSTTSHGSSTHHTTDNCVLHIPSLPIITIVSLLLILAGDVETNPGPITVGELFDSLKDLVEWEIFAIHLPMISSSDIEKITRDHTGSIDRQKFHLYSLWLSRYPNASWNDVVQALHKTRNHSMAMKIEEERIIQGHKLQPTNVPMECSSESANGQSCSIISSLPPCLTHYSGLLKQKYKNRPVISSAEWPPRVGKDYYGRLLLLDKEKRDVETEQHKIWNTMRGNIDVLPNVTQSKMVDIPDVLKPDLSAIVLIDGPPGVGKTTFCRKLLNMWANGQLPTDQQQRYTVVLYCSLRDKRITGANTLTDIMKTCYANRDIEKVSEYIDEHDGDGLLIIFDGWDELSMEHRESSLVVQFIRKEILLKCTVIVTSRSYASKSIIKLSENYRHFEVIGFGEEEIHKVIWETLHDKRQLASDLLIELQSQSNIKSLCYIPLVCSMVILVYKKLNRLPSRLTKLYVLFVSQAVNRHVEKLCSNALQIQQLNQLPPCIATSFNKLCHFAYLSLKNNNPRMTFSFSELQEALDVSVAEGYIGLMTTVSVYDEELYQFPHLTIQEFLAAWWIANNDGMDVKAFEEHFEDDHFRMCLRFVAGLTELKNEKFKEFKYFNMQLDLHCTRDDECSRFKTYISLCNHRYLISTDIPQRLLHLLYESSNTDLCKHMASTFIDSSFCVRRFCEKPNSFDVICMLFFLNSSGITWNKIHLWIGNLSPLPGIIMATSTDVIECKELIIECRDVIRPTHVDLTEHGFLNKVLLIFLSKNVYCICSNCYSFHYTLLMLLEKPQITSISIVGNASTIHGSSIYSMELLPFLKERLETTMTLQDLEMKLVPMTSNEAAYMVILGTVIDGVMRNNSMKSLKMIDLMYDSVLLENLKRLFKENTTLDEIEFNVQKKNTTADEDAQLENDTTLEEIGPDVQKDDTTLEFEFHVTDEPPLTEWHTTYDISEINAPLRSVECSWLKPTEIESVLTRCQHLQSLTIDVDDFHQPVRRISITNFFNLLPKLCELTAHSLYDSESWIELFTILQNN